MKIRSGVYWDRGMREENQDSLLLEQVKIGRSRVVLAAVADGIGGLCEGETASGFMLEKLQQCFYEDILPLVHGRSELSRIKRCILRCFYETNQLLNQYALGKEIRLGTTVSILLIYRRRFLIMHLGDSRIYRITARRGAECLTVDHVRQTDHLSRCMGSFPYQKPDFLSGRLWQKSMFLLCTDGYYHTLNKALMEEMLMPGACSEEQLEKRLPELAARALKMGEMDNLSAVCVDVDG